MNICPIIFL